MDAPERAAWSGSPTSLWRRRELIAHLAWADWRKRYQGSALGLAWSFLQPMAMLAVYTFVFGTVFKSRWDVPLAETGPGFALFLFTGLVLFNVFAECVQKAPSLLTANLHYVKRVVFPTEVLAVSMAASALLHFAAQALVLAVWAAAASGSLPLGFLWLPVLVLPLALASLGCAWFLAAAGVFVRDIGVMAGMLTPAVFFLTPIVYPLSAVPERLRPLILLNPLTALVEGARQTLLLGAPMSWGPWALSTALSAGVFFAGYAFFMAFKRALADVL